MFWARLHMSKVPRFSGCCTDWSQLWQIPRTAGAVVLAAKQVPLPVLPGRFDRRQSMETRFSMLYIALYVFPHPVFGWHPRCFLQLFAILSIPPAMRSPPQSCGQCSQYRTIENHHPDSINIHFKYEMWSVSCILVPLPIFLLLQLFQTVTAIWLQVDDQRCTSLWLQCAAGAVHVSRSWPKENPRRCQWKRTSWCETWSESNQKRRLCRVTESNLKIAQSEPTAFRLEPVSRIIAGFCSSQARKVSPTPWTEPQSHREVIPHIPKVIPWQPTSDGLSDPDDPTGEGGEGARPGGERVILRMIQSDSGWILIGF